MGLGGKKRKRVGVGGKKRKEEWGWEGRREKRGGVGRKKRKEGWGWEGRRECRGGARRIVEGGKERMGALEKMVQILFGTGYWLMAFRMVTLGTLHLTTPEGTW